MTKLLGLISAIQAFLNFFPKEARQKTADAILDAVEAANPKLKPTIDIIRMVLNIPDFEDEVVVPTPTVDVG